MNRLASQTRALLVVGLARPASVVAHQAIARSPARYLGARTIDARTGVDSGQGTRYTPMDIPPGPDS